MSVRQEVVEKKRKWWDTTGMEKITVGWHEIKGARDEIKGVRRGSGGLRAAAQHCNVTVQSGLMRTCC